MKFENTEVMNFEGALRGMRNPMSSWNKSDSSYCATSISESTSHCSTCPVSNGCTGSTKDIESRFIIGENDLKLAQKLIRAGSEHRKFMRQIFVSVDITAPLYWWKEFDTYKVGTVANSTSTMHKLSETPINLDCFEMDDFCGEVTDECGTIWDMGLQSNLIPFLEELRSKYNETRNIRYWKELIRWLPESWLQTRTVTMSYENLLAICSKGQRRFHKLNEWSGLDDNTKPNFISWARTLPYAQDLIFIDEVEN